MDAHSLIHGQRGKNAFTPKPKPAPPRPAPRTASLVPRQLVGPTTVITWGASAHFASFLAWEPLPFLKFTYSLLPERPRLEDEAPFTVPLRVLVNDVEVLRVALSSKEDSFQIPLELKPKDRVLLSWCEEPPAEPCTLWIAQLYIRVK